MSKRPRTPRDPSTPSLGTMIRARRCGWGLSHRHGAFIRMSDLPDGRFLVELAPVNHVPCERLKGTYRCWWEGDVDMLAMIPWLQPVRRVHKTFSVTINDDGAIT